MEQRKIYGSEAAVATQARLVIRSKLQAEGRTRDLAMFNLAVHSKLRACDVVALKIADIAPNGYAADRATIRQKKTGQPAQSFQTEQAALSSFDGW